MITIERDYYCDLNKASGIGEYQLDLAESE